jgi:hypothetical protein
MFCLHELPRYYEYSSDRAVQRAPKTNSFELSWILIGSIVLLERILYYKEANYLPANNI